MSSARRWAFRRYHDVLAALNEPNLVVPGTARVASPEHRDVRRAATGDVPPVAVTAARPALTDHACLLLESLPSGGSVCDWHAAVARPWSYAATARLMGLDDAVVGRDAPLARTAFEAAALSTDGETSAAAKSAIVAIARSFGPDVSPASVQTFVALSQSVPAVLSCAIHALLTYPAQFRWMLDLSTTTQGETPSAWTACADELLRYATPTRAVYRRALAEVRVGRSEIAAGDLVVLHLADANRDSRVFEDPDTLNLSRDASRHVSFGVGAHRCVGATIVRQLLTCMLAALSRTGMVLSLASQVPVQWLDGPALRAPIALPVVRGPR